MKQPTLGTTIVVSLLCTVVGSVITVLLTVPLAHYLTARYPVTQLVETVEHEEPFHIGTLVKGQPPLPYTIVQTGTGTMKYGGLLGGSERLTWLYRIQFVNLTEAHLPDVEIVLGHVPNRPMGCMPVTAPALLGDGSQMDRGIWRLFDAKDTPVRVIFPVLPSGAGFYVDWAIESKTRPRFDDLRVTIRCDEGEFERITPLQWKSLPLRRVTPPAP